MTSFHLPNKLLVFMVYYFTEEYLVRLCINKVHGKVLFPSKIIFITSLNKENQILDRVHSYSLYIVGVTWRMVMRRPFMSGL